MALSDEEYRERLREQRRARIMKEGFEISGWDVEPGDCCEHTTTSKVKNRWQTEPCGQPAVAQVEFAGPANPDGLKVKFCRACLGRLIKNLVDYLRY